MSSILIKFHVFQNSLPGVTRTPTWVPHRHEEHQTFLVYETFLKIFQTNFFQKIPASWSVYALNTHQVSSLSKLPSWGTHVLDLGYHTANEEHQPFLVYETFLKIFLMNFFKRIPAGRSVYAHYTHQVSSL